MRLVCISDTHGDHEKLELPEGDVLIHAGDFSAHGGEMDTKLAMKWLGAQGFDLTICIAGNHDTYVEVVPEGAQELADDNGVTLLNDSGCEYQDIRFWGSPITPRFHDWSFMRDSGEAIEKHWRMIPQKTDVLITHGPPYGVLDAVLRPNCQSEHVGCPSLLERVQQVMPTLHLFGHIHEARGSLSFGGVDYHNISSMNEHYRLVHQPVVIDLP